MQLHGIQPFQLRCRVPFKGLYAVIAHIATDGPAGRQVEILTDTIKDGSRKLLIQSHIMGTYTEDIISTGVSEAYSNIYFRGISCISKQIDGRLWIHVHQPDFMSNGIF